MIVVICDHCDKRGPDFNYQTATAARMAAVVEGWLSSISKGDLCPHCREVEGR